MTLDELGRVIKEEEANFAAIMKIETDNEQLRATTTPVVISVGSSRTLPSQGAAIYPPTITTTTGATTTTGSRGGKSSGGEEAPSLSPIAGGARSRAAGAIVHAPSPTPARKPGNSLPVGEREFTFGRCNGGGFIPYLSLP